MRGNDGSIGDIEQIHTVLAQSGADFLARHLGVTGGAAIEKPNRRPAHKASSPVAGVRVLPIPASLMKSPHDTSAARFGHQGSLPANSNWRQASRSEEHTSELQSRGHLVCRLLLEKKKTEDGRSRTG